MQNSASKKKDDRKTTNIRNRFNNSSCTPAEKVERREETELTHHPLEAVNLPETSRELASCSGVI